MNLAIERRRVVFEWEGLGLESFRNDTSLSLSVYIYTFVIPKGFEAESFPLKYNPTTSECKIHSFEVDIYIISSN